MKNNYSTASADSQGRETYASPATPLSVTVIPATREFERLSAPLRKRVGGLRVAAYCRVSTGDESQQTSYTNQVNYYTALIRNRINWIFVGVYADEGLSGTSTARRVNFNRMLQDARDGKIDYIITKSISRFARNTVTTLSLARELRSRKQPVGIFFEKEQLDSLDPTGDLILTIMSALAQEESESISRNIRWSLQKKQKAGIPQVNLSRMLGYDKGENGEWLINEPQAKIVRDIFDRYLAGSPANRVAAGLNDSGIVTLTGKRWTASAVIRILRNEKYAGDLLMQKTFTADILSQRPVVNHGQMPRFYIMDHHAPIVPRDAWNRVQLLLDGKEWTLNGSAQEKETDIFATKGKGARGRSAHVFQNLTVFDGADNKAGIPLRRCDYRYFVNLSGSGQDAENKKDGEYVRYSYSVPMWVVGGKSRVQQETCREGTPKEADCNGGTPGLPETSGKTPNVKAPKQEATGMSGTAIPHALYECALEQSFMEMLYACRWDWLQNQKDSLIERMFRISGRELDQDSFGRKDVDSELKLIREQISQILKETETLNDRLKGIEFAGLNRFENGADQEAREALCGKRETYRQRLAALRAREEKLKTEAARPQMYRANYGKFLEYLRKLPEENAAGMPLRINGLCSPGRGDQENTETTETEPTFDLLPFDRAAYSAFIRRGVVYGDVIEYETNFGVRLISSGNARSLADFIGFRRCRPDGTAEALEQAWKVNGRPLHRANVRRSRKKKGNPETCAYTTDPHTEGGAL